MLNYKLSDRQKFDAIWSLLNTCWNEEGGWLITYDICDIYDEYAVVRNYEDSIFERVYYSKNDESDSIEITGRERCYFVDVTEVEKNALDTLRTLNNNTYEKIDELYITATEELEAKTTEINTLTETYTIEKNGLEEKIGEFESKVEELNNSLSTLTAEKEEITVQLEGANTEINTLKEEVETLNSYKTGVEKSEKLNVIAKYSELLTEEIVDKYTTNLDNYTVTDLEKELAYEFVSANGPVFTNNPAEFLIPKDEPTSGLEQLLSKYKK